MNHGGRGQGREVEGGETGGEDGGVYAMNQGRNTEENHGTPSRAMEGQNFVTA